jgi:hypothetical protein
VILAPALKLLLRDKVLDAAFEEDLVRREGGRRRDEERRRGRLERGGTRACRGGNHRARTGVGRRDSRAGWQVMRLQNDEDSLASAISDPATRRTQGSRRSSRRAKGTYDTGSDVMDVVGPSSAVWDVVQSCESVQLLAKVPSTCTRRVHPDELRRQ